MTSLVGAAGGGVGDRAAAANKKVPSALPTGMFFLDTGLNPVWSVVGDDGDGIDDGAADDTVIDGAGTV